MKLRLIREPSRSGATLGSLYIDDVRVCETLEDELRELAGEPVFKWKIAGETAIKAGPYRIVLSRSNRFGVVTPELLHVEGFAGIRIHWGNRRVDTSGCILVGRGRGDAQIFESRLAFEALMAKLVMAPAGAIDLVIENPPSYAATVAAA